MNPGLSITPPQKTHSMLYMIYLLVDDSMKWNLNLDSNNVINSSQPNFTSAECRQSEELNNHMMNCLRYNWIKWLYSLLILYVNSFQPGQSTSEFVRKQLQHTIHGRQKPSIGKETSGTTGQNLLSANLDFRKIMINLIWWSIKFYSILDI